MGAPKGNQFWKARSKHGRDKIFSNADVLWDACTEYFEWCDNNPIYSAKPFSYEGHAWNHQVPMLRAYTLTGLCIFLDITKNTWDNYKSDEDFLTVITRAEEVIYNQKFVGASAGLLNANIIARDLGLSDKKEHSGEVTVKQITGTRVI
jgi:hypothetical protein